MDEVFFRGHTIMYNGRVGTTQEIMKRKVEGADC
jgi:hypothetical protein